MEEMRRRCTVAVEESRKDLRHHLVFDSSEFSFDRWTSHVATHDATIQERNSVRFDAPVLPVAWKDGRRNERSCKVGSHALEAGETRSMPRPFSCFGRTSALPPTAQRLAWNEEARSSHRFKRTLRPPPRPRLPPSSRAHVRQARPLRPLRIFASIRSWTVALAPK